MTALYRWRRAAGELRAVVMEMVGGALPVLTAAAGAARRSSQGTLRAPTPLWSSLGEHWTDRSLCLSHL